LERAIGFNTKLILTTEGANHERISQALKRLGSQNTHG